MALSHRDSSIAVARAVRDALESGAPITDSAREAMPALCQLMRDYDMPGLAADIARLMIERNLSDGKA